MMEIAWTGLASDKTNALHETGIFFLPVLSGISCAIQAKIEHPHHTFIARLAIFNGDLYVHRPDGLGIEICPFNIRAKNAIPLARGLIACTFANDIAQAL